MVRLTTIAIALALALTTGSAAAATWTTPQRLGSDTGSAGGGSLAFTPTGRAYATWALDFVSRGDCYTHCGSRVVTDVASRPPGGAWTAPQRMNDQDLPVAGIEKETALLVGPEIDGDPDGVGGDLGVWAYRFNAASGPAQLGEPLYVDEDLRYSKWGGASVSPSGYGAAIWATRREGHTVHEVLAAQRRPGKPFSRFVVLDRGDGVGDTAAHAATNARGDAVVTWTSGSRIYARVAPHGKGFGPRRTVGLARLPVDPPAYSSGGGHGVAIDDAGNVTVVWARGTYDPSTGTGASETWSARAKMTGRFGSKRQVDAGWSSNALVVEADGSGGVIAAWPGRSGVRVAHVGPGGVQVDTVGDGATPGVALDVAPDGRAAIAYARYETAYSGPGRLQVIVRDADGTFGPIEDPAPDQNAGDASVAWNPVAKQPSVLYRVADGDQGYGGWPAHMWFADRAP